MLTASAVLLTAGALWRSDQETSQSDTTLGHRAPPIALLADALQPHRPIHGRLDGVRHGLFDPTATVPLEAISRTARPGSRSATAAGDPGGPPGSDPAALGAEAARLLYLGEPDVAVELLDEAIRLTPDDAALANDLGVALLESARVDDRAFHFVRAADALLTATRLDPSSATAHFNLAIALEELGLVDAAIATWRRGLVLETDSDWRGEAESRLRQLSVSRRSPGALRARLDAASSAPETSELGAVLDAVLRERAGVVRRWTVDSVLDAWADAYLQGDLPTADGRLATSRKIAVRLQVRLGDAYLGDLIAAIEQAEAQELDQLARAHRRFAEATRLFGDFDAGAARDAFRETVELLDDAPTPLGLAAATELLACTWYDYAQRGSLRTEVEALFESLGDRPYPALRGRLHWIAAVPAYMAGDTRSAEKSLEAAAEAYLQADDVDELAGVSDLFALVDGYLGETERAWNHHLDALRQAPRLERARRRMMVTTDAARALFELGHPEVAVLLIDAGVVAADALGDALPRAETRWWRARIQHRRGAWNATSGDLAEARQFATAIRFSEQRRRMVADIALLEAEVSIVEDPEQALARLEEAEALQRELEVDDLLPEILLAQGRLKRLQGDDPRPPLERAAALFAARRAGIGGARARKTFDERFETLDEERILVELEANRPWNALELADRIRRRAHPLPATCAPVPLFGALEALARELPDDTMALVFRRLDGELVLFAVRGDGLRVHRLRDAELSSALPHTSLARAVEHFDVLVRRDAPTNDVGHLAAALGQHLLGAESARLETTRRLLIVPDEELHQVAWAALAAPHSGAWLVESHELVVSSSLARFLACSTSVDPTQTTGTPSVLAIAAPLGAEEPLPWTLEEARAVAAAYADGRMLDASDTPRRDLLAALTAEPILHLATHGEVDEEFPSRSRLHLGPTAGVLTARDLSDLDLRATQLVVLAACDTARGRIWRQSGVDSLASAALAAGARSVVAPLWAVDDRATAALMTDFHRRLAAGASPAAALRQAQRAAIRDSASPSVWAPFQVHGVN
ncbi:MAG: CHAT domain-containing protein [Acidobacteriota bacterium]